MDNKNLKSFVYKFLNKEVILYIVFGVLTTVVNLVVFTICNRAFDGTNFLNSDFLSFLFLGKPYLLSNTIAWIVAVVFAFFTNKMFVFQSKSFEIKNLLKELTSFLGARVFSLIVEQIGLFILIDKVLLNELVSKIILGIVVVILNYFFSKLFIFKKSKNNSWHHSCVVVLLYRCVTHLVQRFGGVSFGVGFWVRPFDLFTNHWAFWT